MDLGLAGRVAVVTGGSKGIGLAVVRGLAASGVHVIVGARKSSPELDQLARAGQVEVAEVDLAEPGGPARLTALAGDRIDIVVIVSVLAVVVAFIGHSPASLGQLLPRHG